MKSFTSSLLAFAGALALTSAAPAVNLAARSEFTWVTLNGAAEASYSTKVYFGETTYTYNELSISRVAYDYETAYCTFVGINEETAPPVVDNGGQVGPPQTIVSIFCESIAD